MRHRSLFAFLAASAVALPAMAQQGTHLLVADQDAGFVSDVSSGAVLNLDLRLPVDGAPVVEAAATTGAPFEFVSSVAVSPVDGRAYVADLGFATPQVGRIFAVDGRTGAVETIWEGAPLVSPFSLAFAPDGRLFIADPEADPSLLGAGPACGNFGAVFVIDTTACTAPCRPAVLADGTNHVFSPAVRSAFEEPLGIAFDTVTDRLYVVDACASNVGWNGSLLAVDDRTGRISLVSSTADFILPLAVEVRPDGTPLVVDQGLTSGDSAVFSIDTANADPEGNAAILTSGTQYSMIQDVVVDEADRVFLVDWGEYDEMAGEYLVPPAIWRVDETNPTPGTNGVLVNESVEWLTPVSGAIVPVPRADSLSPSAINGPTNVIIEGAHLHPGLQLDFGPGLAVSSVDFAPGFPVGTAIQATVTPSSTAVVPSGCAGDLDLIITHPFGTRTVVPDAATLAGNNGGLVPASPFSTRGDANRDGIVDGLDLAILGLYFGSEYCDGFAFRNDADFDDNDIIDGQDLARLTAYFGMRP